MNHERRNLVRRGLPLVLHRLVVVDERYGVSGAQPAEAFLELLERAWADTHPLITLSSSGETGSCEGEICAVPTQPATAAS